jgi:3-oxoacyl-[acyl-carrier protein] reductase
LTAHVPKEKLEALMSQQAIHRMGTFQDISNVIDFFIAPASNFVTGQIVYLGGVN